MSPLRLERLFGTPRPVIGVLHLPPLPGSPRAEAALEALEDSVRSQARRLAEGGVDGVLVENFGDVPYYPDRVPRHTVAYGTALARVARRAAELPLGVNVLRNDGLAALSVAAAAHGAFVRINVLTGVRVTDQGLLEGQAHRILRLRRELALDVRVFADVDVKHSAPASPRPLRREVRETLERGGADAVVVTGGATGEPPDPEDLEAAKEAAAGAPVLCGSGATPRTLPGLLERCDGVIVGTAIKEGDDPRGDVDLARVRAFMRAREEALG